MILAGLADSGVFVGQEILAGEPIGVLAGDDFVHEGHENHQLGSSTSGRSQLYMELRFDGQPIDPAPWLKRLGSDKVGTDRPKGGKDLIWHF